MMETVSSQLLKITEAIRSYQSKGDIQFDNGYEAHWAFHRGVQGPWWNISKTTRENGYETREVLFIPDAGTVGLRNVAFSETGPGIDAKGTLSLQIDDQGNFIENDPLHTLDVEKGFEIINRMAESCRSKQ